MDTTQLLTDALTATPDDLALQAALIDHLYGDRDYTHSEACRTVDAVTRAGRDARDLSKAALLLSDRSEIREALLMCLIRRAGVWHPAEVMVVVAANTEPRSLYTVEQFDAATGRHSWALTASANEVLHAAAEVVRSQAQRRGSKHKPRK